MPTNVPLLVTLKDKVAKDLDEQDLSNAFRQIEIWSGNILGIPPPTKSATTVSYTDPTGEAWVAKAGVHGGNYQRARNVLHARIYRNAAFTVGTVATTLTWDSVVSDPYGMLSGGAGFLIPINGVYRAAFQVAATPTATGQWMLVQMGGASTALASVQVATTAVGVYARVDDTRLTTAGNSFTITALASVALAGIPGVGTTFASISYLGSG